MLQKTCSVFVLVFMFASIVSADTFSLPSCNGTVAIGINAIQPIDVYSDMCRPRNDRILDCVCKDNKLELYSKDLVKEYDLVFEYGTMQKRVDNYVFKEAYTNNFLNLVLFIILLVFVGVILIPIIWIYNSVKNEKG